MCMYSVFMRVCVCARVWWVYVCLCIVCACVYICIVYVCLIKVYGFALIEELVSSIFCFYTLISINFFVCEFGLCNLHFFVQKTYFCLFV